MKINNKINININKNLINYINIINWKNINNINDFLKNPLFFIINFNQLIDFDQDDLINEHK